MTQPAVDVMSCLSSFNIQIEEDAFLPIETMSAILKQATSDLAVPASSISTLITDPQGVVNWTSDSKLVFEILSP